MIILTNMILVKIIGRYGRKCKSGKCRSYRGKRLKVKESRSSQSQDYINLITLTGTGKASELSISGTVTGVKNRARFVSIDKFAIDMVPSKSMAFIRYEDVPGQIGKIGTAFGKLGINIASMHVGRKKISEKQ